MVRGESAQDMSEFCHFCCDTLLVNLAQQHSFLKETLTEIENTKLGFFYFLSPPMLHPELNVLQCL